MSLWEAFCERFDGKPVEAVSFTENGVETVEDPTCRRFQFSVQMEIEQDWFERNPEKTINYMEDLLKTATKNAGKEMRAELGKLRSQGQKTVI